MSVSWMVSWLVWDLCSIFSEVHIEMATIPFHSQEWSISNFLCSLTRNITSHSVKNLAFQTVDKIWLNYQFSLQVEKSVLWLSSVNKTKQAPMKSKSDRAQMQSNRTIEPAKLQPLPGGGHACLHVALTGKVLLFVFVSSCRAIAQIISKWFKCSRGKCLAVFCT